MTQSNSTLMSAGALTAGGSLAVLLLFAVRYFAPDLHAAMGDMEKQAITLLTAGIVQRAWSLLGPKGGM